MGAVKPWHLITLTCLCLSTAAIIAAVVVLLTRRKK